jgi:hypothetical protein
MVKRKPSQLMTGDLLAQPAKEAAVAKEAAPGGAVALPAILEYTPLASMEKWRVEKYELFAAEMELPGGEREMVLFHECAQEHTRGWMIARRLFGIAPLIPPPDAHPDDLHVSTREALCAALGLERAELQAELDALRTLWREHRKRESQDVAPATAEHKEGQRRELEFDDDVLKEFGFEDKMFEMISIDWKSKTEEARSQAANRVEKIWFTGRVKEWRKMLQEPMASALAREALMNELYLKRFGVEMSGLGPSHSKWKELYNSKKQLEQMYQEQLDKLQMMFPEMAIAGKVSFRATISDLNKAHRDYYGRSDRRLVDKIFTATEIEVMLRMSKQNPEPRYRFGLNIAIVEAMHGLYDPNFRSQFKQAVLAKLDKGFREAVVRLREEGDEPLVDMENGVEHGEGDDYPDLLVPDGREPSLRQKVAETLEEIGIERQEPNSRSPKRNPNEEQSR